MYSKKARRIKIAQVITRLDWSGAPDIMRTICSRLDPERYEMTLISGLTAHPSEKTKEFLKKFEADIKIISCLKREISIFDDLTALIRLYFLFRREKFDMVHTHTAKAGFIGRIAAKLAGVPVVIHTPHGHNFYGYFNSLGNKFIVILEKFAAFFADRIVVFTGIEKNDMVKYKICKGSKIDVIRSGIDMSKFDNVKIDAKGKKAEFNADSNNFLVGMIGRLENVKGSEYFIDSAKFIARALPQTRFLVVGDGSLKTDLISQSALLGLSDKIIFTGWREDIPEILSILDVLVLPSLNEAVGRVLLEAGATGKPIVATDVGGVPEVLKTNETGILVPARDPGKMAEAVVSLLKDENRRHRMGDAAKNWVRTNFDENGMITQLHNIYMEAVNR